jgi:hypothetical protein
MIEFCHAPIVVETPVEKIDMYRLGDNGAACTIRPHFRHPTSIPRSDLFECPWPRWSDYFCAAEVVGSAWDRCRSI